MHYWLIKSEPDAYSIDDLKRGQTTSWGGVRNYQARNLMRDGMKKGDLVLFYHSSTNEVGVVGVAKISKEAYPDPIQFDTTSEYFDPKSTNEKPVWVAVDVSFVKKFKIKVLLSILKNDPFFKTMPLVQKGMRLSVQPVDEKHFKKILSLVT